jgi:hypothetical protein
MEDREEVLKDVIAKAQDVLATLEAGNHLDHTQQAFFDIVSQTT